MAKAPSKDSDYRFSQPPLQNEFNAPGLDDSNVAQSMGRKSVGLGSFGGVVGEQLNGDGKLGSDRKRSVSKLYAPVNSVSSALLTASKWLQTNCGKVKKLNLLFILVGLFDLFVGLKAPLSPRPYSACLLYSPGMGGEDRGLMIESPLGLHFETWMLPLLGLLHQDLLVPFLREDKDSAVLNTWTSPRNRRVCFHVLKLQNTNLRESSCYKPRHLSPYKTMIINEIPSDPPTTPTRIPRRFFANQPPPPPPRIIEEVPNNAPGKTLAELFASYNQIRQVSTDTNNHYFQQNGPVLTHTEPNLSHVDVNAASPATPNAPTSSYNPTQHIGTPPRLWFPPRPPGQDIDGNTSIPDNPWTPPPFSAVMEDAPRTPSAPRSQSVSMSDQIRTPISKFRSFFSDFFTTTTNVPVESVWSNIFNPEIQPARRHSGINSHLSHPYREQPTDRRILATAPVLPDPPISTP
ncbi:hypothetical protein V494_04088, partial [Pseudogymnoascus sp. VKM F-4513 (FW-928)]